MESLDDTFGPRVPLGSRRTRLLVGAAILLGAVPVATVHLHGLLLDHFVTSMELAAAQQTAIALSALFLPTVFAISLHRLPASRAVRLAAVGGVVLDTLVAALFLIVVPSTAVSGGTIPLSIVTVYGVGAVVAIGAPLATIVAAIYQEDGSAATPKGVNSKSSTGTARNATAMPTDGGRERDGLDFLLDDDR